MKILYFLSTADILVQSIPRQKMNYLARLPCEIEDHIFYFLPSWFLPVLSMVCLRYRHLSFNALNLFVSKMTNFTFKDIRITSIPLSTEGISCDRLYMVPSRGDDTLFISHGGKVCLLVFTTMIECFTPKLYRITKLKGYMIRYLLDLGFYADRCAASFVRNFRSHSAFCKYTYTSYGYYFDYFADLHYHKFLGFNKPEPVCDHGSNECGHFTCFNRSGSSSSEELCDFVYSYEEDYDEEYDERTLKAVQLEHLMEEMGEAYFEMMNRGEWDDEELLWCIGEFGF